MRVFALSDVHADFRENLQLVAALPMGAYRRDALILAGDVTHDLALLRRTLELFRERFAQVFFVPGNHELWIRRSEHEDSVQKFYDVLKLCDSLDVRTTPECIGEGQGRVCIVPLFSWYTRPEEGSDSLYRARDHDDATLPMWADNYLVKWPQPRGFSGAQFFTNMNSTRVSASYEASRISFSHFLPRGDLMFASKEEGVPAGASRHDGFNFSRVAGSTLIESQIRTLAPRVHVYGHQHRNRCRYLQGIWYVSNCLGYRDERGRDKAQAPTNILKPIWPLEESGLPGSAVAA